MSAERNRSAANTGRPLSDEDLETELAIELPDREAMSTIQGPVDINGNVAIPINEAEATNVNSDYSVAIADADQYVIVDQVDTDSSDAGQLPLDQHGGGHKH